MSKGDFERRVGARLTSDGRLEAHAWLEHESRVVLGASGVDLAGFVPLVAHPQARDPAVADARDLASESPP